MFTTFDYEYSIIRSETGCVLAWVYVTAYYFPTLGLDGEIVE